MALDVHVMPLWRFKAGEFASPIEENLGIAPTVVSLESPPLPRPPWHLRLLAKLGIIELIPEDAEPTPEEERAQARKEVRDLKRELSRSTGTSVDWPDNGGVEYSKQFGQPVTLRAFAAWCDHRDQLPEFTPAPKRNYYEHPVWNLPPLAAPRFPTLVKHSLHTGYFLPVPFEGVHRVEPFKVMDHWEFFHHVASTQTILREVTDVLEVIATVPEIPDPEDGYTAVGDARWYAEELQRICTLSIQHDLPVIFHG